MPRALAAGSMGRSLRHPPPRATLPAHEHGLCEAGSDSRCAAGRGLLSARATRSSISNPFDVHLATAAAATTASVYAPESVAQSRASRSWLRETLRRYMPGGSDARRGPLFRWYATNSAGRTSGTTSSDGSTAMTERLASPMQPCHSRRSPSAARWTCGTGAGGMRMKSMELL
jgi:hypothetical protein